jgi:hypothetical protein
MNPGGAPGSDWRYGMPGNWNLNQNINSYTNQVEWPTGPLTLNPGEDPIWIEAWVVQSTTGASQNTAQSAGWAPNYVLWTADGIPPGSINGQFTSGPALGIALLATHNNNTGEDDAYWWLDLIILS